MIPVSCDQYTRTLEETLAALVYAVGADSELAQSALKILNNAGFDVELIVKEKAQSGA